jgi:hypothetical protein
VNILSKFDFPDDRNLVLSDVCALRRLVGVLGMLLPGLLLLGLLLVTGYGSPLSSISHYYYTRVGSVFVIVVSLLAIFLILYKGKQWVDFWLSTVAGLSALAVLLFPTGNLGDLVDDPGRIYSVTILPVSQLREDAHYICAGIFLACLAAMSLFLFTKTDPKLGKKTKAKVVRNWIYIGCGLLMVLAMLVILFDFLSTKYQLTILIPHDWYVANQLTFWMETLAVGSFGVSWLIKGETFFKDPPKPVAASASYRQTSP